MSDAAHEVPAGPQAPSEHQHQFYLWLDSFRAIAAIMVMVSHTRDIVFQDYSGNLASMPFYLATSLGHTGVVLFFVMSGFWISMSVESRIAGRDFWASYLTARLSRLWVVLVPALLLGGTLDVIGRFALDLPAYRNAIGSHSLNFDMAAQLTLPIFFGNVGFLQTIVTPVFGSNGPLWSLAAEFWYYLWFPVLLILIQRKRSIPWLLLAACVAIAALQASLILGFFVWLLGVGARKLPFAGLASLNGNRAILVCTTLLLLGALAASGAFKQAVPDLVIGVLFAAQIVALRIARLPYPRLLTGLAAYGRQSSFSLYAIHFPLVLLLGGLADGEHRFALGLPGFLVFGAIVATCLVAAWIFSTLTERHTDAVRAFAGRQLGALRWPTRPAPEA